MNECRRWDAAGPLLIAYMLLEYGTDLQTIAGIVMFQIMKIISSDGCVLPGLRCCYRQTEAIIAFGCGERRARAVSGQSNDSAQRH